MKNSIRISFAIVFLILGIVVTIQYKSTEKNKKISDIQGKSVQEVQALLLREKEYSEKLSVQISEDQKKIQDYEKNVNVADIIKKDLDKARVLAGLTDVVGKGIVINIDDTKSTNTLQGIVPNSEGYFLRDENLLELLNELRAAGAEAISINDERIIATTEVRKAGIYFRINNKNTNSPFVVKVIGDPSALEGSLKIRNGIIEYLMLNKVEVTIQKSDSVSIPKYNGIININDLSKL